jgi:hypothetical protein
MALSFGLSTARLISRGLSKDRGGDVFGQGVGVLGSSLLAGCTLALLRLY